MNFTNDGLSLWYGTPDAPAPGDGGVVPRRGASLVVGVHPANPTNNLVVRYRVDGGIVQTVTGRELRNEHDRQTQYFAVAFPPFVTGDTVEYSPVLTCSGRQVPAAHIASQFPSKFHLAPAETPPARRSSAQPLLPKDQRFVAGLDFVAHVAVQFDPPQFVGDTAAGMRVNFFVREGTFESDAFKGRVMEHSADHLLIRRDGMGEVRIRASFETSEGARLDVESGGYADFGPDGYRRAVARDLPDRAALVVSPLITTRHPRYRDLSRVQCVGVGYTHLDAGQASYDVYAVSSRRVK